MKADYSPFGGQRTKQHLKRYNSQVIPAKSDCTLWSKSEVKRPIVPAHPKGTVQMENFDNSKR